MLVLRIHGTIRGGVAVFHRAVGVAICYAIVFRSLGGGVFRYVLFLGKGCAPSTDDRFIGLMCIACLSF